MRPTGWFQIGWSAEIPPSGVKAMTYFGQELVAFRSETGELSILDAYCRHLGAHLGHGSHVRGDCVVCPYHGWEWNLEGANTRIPYQEIASRARIRRHDVVERHGIIFMWHSPDAGPARPDFELPDLFTGFREIPAEESAFHPCFPEAIVDKPDEPIHPQLIQENAADCMHFQFTHSTPKAPEMLWFETEGSVWRSKMGFTSPKTDQIALRLYNVNPGVGLSFAVFDGDRSQYRLILSATPVDEERSDLRVSYFLPREPDSPDTMTAAQRAFAEQTVELFEQDARIWRHQVFVQKPVFARQDVAAYSALRKWSEQFYEVPEGRSPTRSVAE